MDFGFATAQAERIVAGGKSIGGRARQDHRGGAEGAHRMDGLHIHSGATYA